MQFALFQPYPNTQTAKVVDLLDIGNGKAVPLFRQLIIETHWMVPSFQRNTIFLRPLYAGIKNEEINNDKSSAHLDTPTENN
jgi:hypothetical protein